MRKLIASAPVIFFLLIMPVGCPVQGNILDQKIYKASAVTFVMTRVPAAVFPKGADDSRTGAVDEAFEIAETEVAADLWVTVYYWATSAARGVGRYTFANTGQPGGGRIGTLVPDVLYRHPVTGVNWRDCLVFCNAVTEWYNYNKGTRLTPVYYADAEYTVLIRDSRGPETFDSIDAAFGTVDNPFVKPGADGFRLPTADEWELSARFVGDFNLDGDITDPGEYTPGLNPSGSRADYTDCASNGDVAWYIENSEGATHPVKTRAANALGLFDMSGNVGEWCFSWADRYGGQSGVGVNRALRGGNWNAGCGNLTVSLESELGGMPYLKSDTRGFRIARTPGEKK